MATPSPESDRQLGEGESAPVEATGAQTITDDQTTVDLDGQDRSPGGEP